MHCQRFCHMSHILQLVVGLQLSLDLNSYSHQVVRARMSVAYVILCPGEAKSAIRIPHVCHMYTVLANINPW
jgi:hypothetical protein